MALARLFRKPVTTISSAGDCADDAATIGEFWLSPAVAGCPRGESPTACAVACDEIAIAGIETARRRAKMRFRPLVITLPSPESGPTGLDIWGLHLSFK